MCSAKVHMISRGSNLLFPTCSYDPLQLVGLDPDELVDALVAPQLQALPSQLHGAPSHPQKDQAVILKIR